MVHYQTEGEARILKKKVQEAVDLAMHNRWEEAVIANRAIIELFPSDVDSYNRLGRALTELGHYSEAREAYRKAAEIDPTNTIAQKNLARLSKLTIEEAPTKAHEGIDPHLFIAETGKTGVTSLVRLTDKTTLAKMTVGDQVYLKPEGRALLVLNAHGDYLGQIEPRLGHRLIDLIQGGNQYAAALVSVGDDDVKVIIRETRQDPSQAGKVSFPSKGADVAAIRPYIKGSLFKEEIEEEESIEETGYGLESVEEEEEEPLEETEFEEEDSIREES